MEAIGYSHISTNALITSFFFPCPLAWLAPLVSVIVLLCLDCISSQIDISVLTRIRYTKQPNCNDDVRFETEVKRGKA